MRAEIYIQIVWNQGRGVVQMFVGDSCSVDLPPALCAELEANLAAARRVPERARQMAQSNAARVLRQAQDDRDIAAWGGDPSVCM